MTSSNRGGIRVSHLNPLRAFEAAARHLNFTVAADELCVTQGAISRSVRTLELYYGVPLFKRNGNGLELTPKSGALAGQLTDVFNQLAEATEEFEGVHQSQVLTIWTYTSFMIGFLIPNLPDFQVKHPKIKVRLISANDGTNFDIDQVDVRIRYGRGYWRDSDNTLLFNEVLRPVCSPKLLEAGQGKIPVAELEKHVLLHYEGRRKDWADWLAAAGYPQIKPRDNLYFDELSLSSQAAISGVGVAMVQQTYFRNEIESGQLVVPFDSVLHREYGYYLCVPIQKRRAEHVRVFRDWLLERLADAPLDDSELAGPCAEEWAPRLSSHG